MTNPYHRRRKQSWVLEHDVIANFPNLVAIEIAGSIRATDTIGDIVRRYWARCRCRTCGVLGACAHRDKVSDLELISSCDGWPKDA